MSKINGILMLLIYICVVTALLNEVFVDSNNLGNVAKRIALFGIIGIGVAFVIITGGIDLSIGSLVGLVGCVMAMLLTIEYEPLGQATVANIQENRAEVRYRSDQARYGPGDFVALYDGKASNQGIYEVGSESELVEEERTGNTADDTLETLRSMSFVSPLPSNDRQGKLMRVYAIDEVDRDYYDFIIDELPMPIESRDRLLFFSTGFQRSQQVTVSGVFLEDGKYHIELEELPEDFDLGGHFGVIERQDFPVGLAILIVMGMSLGIGLIHGLLITKVRLQPFVVTLCGLLIYRGVARTLTQDQSVGFGSEYDESLRMIALGTPCSVATLLIIAGLVIALLNGIRFVIALRSKDRTDESEMKSYSVALFTVFGLLIALVGSSRFWHGIELNEAIADREPLALFGLTIPLWPYEVTEKGAAMPSQLMAWIGWCVIPAGVFFLGMAWMKQPQRMLKPTIGMLVAIAVFAGGMWVKGWPDDSFGGLSDWATTIRILTVFSACGILFGCIGWLSREGLKNGGRWARFAGLLTGFFAVMWLAGKTEVAETLVPAPFFVFAFVGVVSAIFMTQTIYGRYLLALGRNEQAARFSGIKTDRMVIVSYVICSGCAGLGGVLFALDLNSIQPAQHGNFYELYAIAAAVLGGCSLRGGEGTILGVIIGAAVMRVLRNSIFLVGIPDQLEFAIIGAVILAGVIVDEVVRRMSLQQRAKVEAQESESAAES